MNTQTQKSQIYSQPQADIATHQKALMSGLPHEGVGKAAHLALSQLLSHSHLYMMDGVNSHGERCTAVYSRLEIERACNSYAQLLAENERLRGALEEACNQHAALKLREKALMDTCQLALELIRNHFPLEHGDPKVAAVWDALENAVLAQTTEATP